MLADLVLSSPFFILFTCFSPLRAAACFFSSFAAASAIEFEEDDVEEEEDDGDSEELERCFFNLSSSFHKTVHLGGLGDGSSSKNQFALLCSLLSLASSRPSSSPSSLEPRLILFSLSDCCICQKGSSFPSQKSSSAEGMESMLTKSAENEILGLEGASLPRGVGWPFSTDTIAVGERKRERERERERLASDDDVVRD
ncbi:hypothetical protein EUGRSUZ_H03551 [Eucalyptus grandis]|uniref:Uncharacterized protein n=2 Tax=Eucalyptus grandis TaxID=71139 RepID=A0ACC3JUB2_EUCGR|nr:hypothetical protein EUGRSUZ_H03551 [Eucalyptus grandis]